MKNDKMVYFVTGLPHSGTSIVQKTISNQKGYVSVLKENGNVFENTNFTVQLNNGDLSNEAAHRGHALHSVVTKLPCEPDYFQDIFYRIKKYLHNPNLHITFTKRDPVQWCLSYLVRTMHPNSRTKDIDLEFNKKMPDFKSKQSPKVIKNINSKKAFILYLKELYDYYCETVDNIINSEREAKVTCIDLLDFSNDPDKFLKTIGFEDPIIEGKDSDGEDIENILDEWRHEKKRAAQIANKPNPNIIKKKYEKGFFHPTIIDFIEKIFNEK